MAKNKQKAPKFRRAPPAVRREALVAATLACLRKHGHEGVSVRKISAQAGVSVGLINHHFPGKATLVAEAYDSLATELLNALRREAREAAATPRERLRRFFAASFTPQLIDGALFNVWLVFWSMVSHSAEMRAVHDRTYREYRRTLEALLGQLRQEEGMPPFKLRQAAISLSALLDGLWIEFGLNPKFLRAGEAIALCEDWVQALCDGAFRSLRGADRSRRTAITRR